MMPADSGTSVSQSEVGWRFDNTYSRLPETCFATAKPASVREARLVLLNRPLAAELGLNLDALSTDQAAQLFAGQAIPDGAFPIAQAYAGHQFGSFTMLGDGRAILLGEHRTPAGKLVDIQFKGAGQTRFSRRGDGRAALGPMLREYIISEAMAALGIPTTRSLAVVTTGERVYRETALRGAVLTRVAASHLRVGTFEYLAARGEVEHLRTVADYAIERHYAELRNETNRYLQFLRAVINRQAALVAKWQLNGFIHGVMNTDNVAISGETIDYGPCAFMNAYHPETVFSSIDRDGRYAYGNQPQITQWNLTRFAESLLPLIDAEEQKSVELATDVLRQFSTLFHSYWLTGMRAKLGLRTAEPEDAKLVESLLTWMASKQADFTNTFRELSQERAPEQVLSTDSELQEWRTRWLTRLEREPRPQQEIFAEMQTVNPAFIPRNHRVEEVLEAAEERNDLAPLHRLLLVLSRPYDEQPDYAEYREPQLNDCHYQTFCGT